MPREECPSVVNGQGLIDVGCDPILPLSVPGSEVVKVVSLHRNVSLHQGRQIPESSQASTEDKGLRPYKPCAGTVKAST